MSILESVLNWLAKFKPLWEFLTALGTVSAVVVSLYLASRKPKAHLTLSVELLKAGDHTPDVAAWTIVNDGEADQIILRWYWRAQCTETGRIYLSAFCELNGRGGYMLPQRIVKDDMLTGRDPLTSIADLANPHISAKATPEEIEKCFRGSKFGCVTTTGKLYETDMPQTLQTALLARFRSVRGPI